MVTTYAVPIEQPKHQFPAGIAAFTMVLGVMLGLAAIPLMSAFVQGAPHESCAPDAYSCDLGNMANTAIYGLLALGIDLLLVAAGLVGGILTLALTASGQRHGRRPSPFAVGLGTLGLAFAATQAVVVAASIAAS